MIKQMERSFEIGRKLIETEMNAGFLDILVKPIIISFYKHWMDKDARIGTLEQIRVTLDCAKDIENNSGSITDEKSNQIIEEYLPIYLKNDQTYKQCKKRHKNFNKLVEITKKCFISQVEESVLFFKINKEGIESYDDLCREVFKSKKNAYISLMRQLHYNEEGIKIVEKDPSILNILTGRNTIIKILRRGFEITKKELIKNLDNIFG